ncbi:hypothetical protein GQX73_g10145 [Xylaria multiplex]|uniref:Uncharacterized protein n=1 Tax=Xylaria multiplex TaxID=323545 RepID=A0A7C8IJW1_9PEZI|nr:hypothetical protein GQX73_g10145 [Xylaria multiplex]
MALELHIPACIFSPAHPFHLPPLERPLRIQIEGPLTAIQRLVPGVSWHANVMNEVFPMPGGNRLAELTYRALYGADVRSGVPRDMVIRDQYLRHIAEGKIPLNEIDYYGVAFDHLVPADDLDPDVLQINICEMDYDGGEETNKHLLFLVNPADYIGKKVLAVPRCCQKRKGTQDRNDQILQGSVKDTLSF